MSELLSGCTTCNLVKEGRTLPALVSVQAVCVCVSAQYVCVVLCVFVCEHRYVCVFVCAQIV